MRGTARSNLVTVALAAIVLSGCDPSTKKKDPKIEISLSNSSATVGQGANTQIVITLIRTNFDKPVALVAEGVPSGVGATFSPSSIPGASSASTLQLNASGTAAPGAATITVRATGEGVTEQAATINLAVNVTGDFTLAVMEPSLTVAQGGGGLATVLVNRTSLNAGNVTLTTTGLPTGVTATFSQSPTTQKATSLAFTATASAAPGTYSVTISGSQPGLSQQSTTLSINLIAPPSTASITVPFCVGDVPVWFAFQNEGFGWQQVTATGTSFTFSAAQKLAIAFVFQVGAESETDVYFATRAELAAITDRDCGGTKTLNGTVVGTTGNQTALMVMGNSAATPTAGSYTLPNVADKPLDLVATSGTALSGFLSPSKMIVRRALNLPTQSTITTLDFAGAEAFAPAANTLTITGLAGEIIELQNTFWTTTSTFGLAHSSTFSTGQVTLFSAPAAQQVTGDVHELLVDAYVPPDGTTGRAVVSYFAAPTDQTVVLGPAISTPTVSVLTATPYPRMRGQLPGQAQYASQARFVFLQGSSPQRRFIALRATAAYYGAAPSTWDLVVPDLTGTSGFNASSWMFGSGLAVAYSATAFSGRNDIVFGALPSAGDVLKYAYTVPPPTSTFRELRGAAAAGRARSVRPFALRQYFSR